MLETIVVTLLPVVVTLMLGFFAGWHRDLRQEEASGILNRMVMLYALPMTLFVGIMTTPVMEITRNVPVFIWLAVGMVGAFAVVFVLSRFVFHSTSQVAALRALAIGGPAVPFVGIPVLGQLFPADADIAVATGNLLLNLVMLPIALAFLVVPAGGAGIKASPLRTAGLSIVHTVRQPVIWAPVFALVLLLCGVRMPDALKGSFTLLGNATGGVALFAVGAVLFAQKVRLSLPVIVNVLSKNILVPLILLLLMLACGASKPSYHLVTVILAIPTASISVILAVEYKVAEQEMASTLFASTLLSMVTMAGFIWAIGL